METAYLTSSAFIDWQAPSVFSLARSLSGSNDTETARSCFLHVRDKIPHCCDITTTATPLTASEVLATGTGFCYAKSHLLAALLRANGIPAGLGYVRLAQPWSPSGFALHGFNWVFLQEYRWLRMDARGNNGKVFTDFEPPEEFLAHYPGKEGESFVGGNFIEPLPAVVEAYQRATDFKSLLRGLPDVT